MKKTCRIWLVLVGLLAVSYLAPAPLAWSAAFVDPTLSQYSSCIPIFISTAVKPRILVLMANTKDQNDRAYPNQAYDHSKKYYGYFESYIKYSYSSNLWSRDTSGLWDGNFLNWATMRKIDIMKKVLTGGQADSATGIGAMRLVGDPSASAYDILYYATSNPPTYTNDPTFTLAAATAASVTPYNQNLYFGLGGGSFYIASESNKNKIGLSPAKFWDLQNGMTIKVQKCDTCADELATVFHNGAVSGILQKVGDKAYWGLEFLTPGSGGGSYHGGFISQPISDPSNFSNFITDVRNTSCNADAQLAEGYYVAIQYFKQQAISLGGYKPGAESIQANTADPFRPQLDAAAACAKSFVLLIGSNLSAYDQNIPSPPLGGISNTGLTAGGAYNSDFGYLSTNMTYPNSGSHSLIDLALYARTTDLRADISGSQNLMLYTVYALGDTVLDTSKMAIRDLMDAAKYGGYTEKDGNLGPTLQAEWNSYGRKDSSNRPLPDTFFQATEGDSLEAELMAAINDILKRSSSSTAVSVLSTSAEGEGTMVQAYFKPAVPNGLDEVSWVGYLQSLWVDAYGQMRECTYRPGGNPTLKLTQDPIVEFYFDSSTAQAKFRRYALNANGTKSTTYTEHLMEDVVPIWEAGNKLALRSDAFQRNIKTFLDTSNYGVVDSGEFVNFSTANVASILPFLGATGTYSYLDTSAGATNTSRATNLIKFIRGDKTTSGGWQGTPNLRFRNLQTASGTVTWRLGDIINSTPVTVSRPLDNYGIIYSDQSYQDYYIANAQRETVIYVGANDGMLHAFYMGKYVSTADISNPSADQGHFEKPVGVSEDFGDELWAYIPQAVLPHLKWLADPNYSAQTHVYYVDLKPKVVDARIFTNALMPNHPDLATKHPNGWGTILIGGLNLGGVPISVPDGGGSREFTASYFAIDITDPHNPYLLWEKTFPSPDKSLTASYPAVTAIVNNSDYTPSNWTHDWYVVVGSGPTSCDGLSTQTGKVYVLNLHNGTFRRTFTTGESNAFMGGAITVDYTLDYKADVGYIGETYGTTGNWQGKLYRFRMVNDSNMDSSQWTYYTNPADWTFSSMLSTTGPITVTPSASVDPSGNLWVYTGTGRYINNADKTDLANQYFFGLMDPYYQKKYPPVTSPATRDDMYVYTQATASTKVLTTADLLNATDIHVYTDGSVSGGPSTTWAGLLSSVLGNYNQSTQTYSPAPKNGWYVTLTNGERVLNKPTILGGAVLNATFTPNADLCGFGGNSNLWAWYYITGTAYTAAILPGGTAVVGGKTEVLRKIDVGLGRGSQVSIHVGQESGATGYVQQSTGIISQFALTPPLQLKSGLIYWRER